VLRDVGMSKKTSNFRILRRYRRYGRGTSGSSQKKVAASYDLFSFACYGVIFRFGFMILGLMFNAQLRLGL
jgi:hypothetical protein